MKPETLVHHTITALTFTGHALAWCAVRCYRAARALQDTLDLANVSS